LEIVVLDKQSDKLIRMDVLPEHTIGSIIETIVDKRKLDKSQMYKLTLGDWSFGKEQYLLKVKDVGISHGDHLFLGPERQLQPPTAKPPAAYVPKFCIQCGEPLRAASKFCLECGAAVGE